MALWICIKGVIRKDNNKKDYTLEELKALPRMHINSGEALKLMGLDVKECKKVKINEKECAVNDLENKGEILHGE